MKFDLAKNSMSRRMVPVMVILFLVTGTALKPSQGPESEYFSIAKNIELLGDVYRGVSEKYVDSINAAEFMYAGIDGMLETLDPYTVFLDKEESQELGELTSGQYAGIGVRISEIAGDVYIVSVFEGTPAAHADLRVGDRIVKVDSHVVEGKELDEVKDFIKGPSGSRVTLSIERYGQRRKKRYTLIRQEVRINSVQYAWLFGTVGYFEMNSFGNRSADELGKAISEMQAAARIKNRPMTAVILDLRNNPGGLLDVAVDVTGLFVEKGSQVVSTRGRDPESEIRYQTAREPSVERLPLVVLINKNSASASEIVAGAIQELDRGVVIGDRSFGKGLVQSVISLPYDCTLKLTTAKYYTPSGRLIQKEHGWTGGARDVLMREEKEKDKKVFYTRNSRKVYGGGGILPDIRVEAATLTDYEASLRKEGMLFRYANKYRAANDRLPEAGLDRTSLMRDFERFVKKEGFSYQTEPEILLEAIEKSLEDEQEKASGKVDTLIASLESEMKRMAAKEVSDESETIALALEQEIMRHFDENAARRSIIEGDPAVKKALSILRDSGEYREILNP